MIRHKASGEELVWCPTEDGLEGRRLMPVDGDFESPIAYWYPPPIGSSTWISQCRSVGAQTSPQAVEAILADDGYIEIIDDPPAAVTSAGATPVYVDHCLIEDVRALAIRLFLAGHDEAAVALRRLL